MNNCIACGKQKDPIWLESTRCMDCVKKGRKKIIEDEETFDIQKAVIVFAVVIGTFWFGYLFGDNVESTRMMKNVLENLKQLDFDSPPIQ